MTLITCWDPASIRPTGTYEGQQGLRYFEGSSAGMPHLPDNPSETEPCTVVLARTDPHEQESVVLRPDLEARVK